MSGEGLDLPPERMPGGGGPRGRRPERSDGLDLDKLLADINEPLPEGFRSGMIALVGRPNVGKSTLLNAMVGEKVSIVTDVPGTTRNAIRGVVERADAQLVFLDTPGVMKPRSLLSKRLNELVKDSWVGVNVVCFLIDVHAGLGVGDRWIAERLRAAGVPVVCVANKEDLVTDKHRLLPQLAELDELLDPLEVVPTSAQEGLNVDVLLDVLDQPPPGGAAPAAPRHRHRPGRAAPRRRARPRGVHLPHA